jgi:hypothetical protein
MVILLFLGKNKLQNYRTIRNHKDNIIEFLRLPRRHGERRTESRLRAELGVAKINLLPLGWGK